jgi:hypothetical protein
MMADKLDRLYLVMRRGSYYSSLEDTVEAWKRHLSFCSLMRLECMTVIRAFCLWWLYDGLGGCGLPSIVSDYHVENRLPQVDAYVRNGCVSPSRTCRVAHKDVCQTQKGRIEVEYWRLVLWEVDPGRFSMSIMSIRSIQG